MRIQIPEHLGQVIPFECPGSERTVAIVPRVVSLSGYVNRVEGFAAGVMDHLARNYGLRTVFTDSMDGEITRTRAKALYERRTTGDKGIEDGVEYFLATTDFDAIGIGLDIGNLFRRSEGTADLPQYIPYHSLHIINSIESTLKRSIEAMVPEVVEFDRKVTRYRAWSMRTDEFFYYLEKKAKELEVDTKKYFPRFCEAVEALRSAPEPVDKPMFPPWEPQETVADRPAFSWDVRILEMVIRERLSQRRYNSEDALKLVTAHNNLKIIKNMIKFKASPEMMDEFDQMGTKFSSLYFEDILSNWGEEIPGGIEIIDHILPQLADFYRTSFNGQRFDALEIAECIKDRKERLAAAVVKGFNVDTMINALRAGGISSYKAVPNVEFSLLGIEGSIPRKESELKNTRYPEILTGEEEEAFREVFPQIASEYVPVDRVSRGAYKRVVKLRRADLDSPDLLALKIADIRDPQLTDRAKVYLEKEMVRGGYKSYREVLEAEAKRARKLAKLGNKHISRLLDADEWSDTLFLFLEDYSESTLRNHVMGHHLNTADVMSIAEQLASGLAAMHSMGMYHGYMKPENILYRNGIITITDFGLTSSLPDENGLSIFNETAAPEIIEGSPHTQQSDIWTYGVDMFFVKIGEFPFPKSCSERRWEQMPYEERREWVLENIAMAIEDYDTYGSAMRRIDEEFDREHFGSMAKILKKCLSKEPGKRYSSGKRLYNAIRSITSPPFRFSL